MSAHNLNLSMTRLNLLLGYLLSNGDLINSCKIRNGVIPLDYIKKRKLMYKTELPNTSHQ